jgi:hypothetical protein
MKTTEKPAIATTTRLKVRLLSAADLRLAVGGEQDPIDIAPAPVHGGPTK